MNSYTRRFSDQNNANAEPGVGDINVMVKPSVLKDKTPMCLVNELARHNRIQHQYRLTKEEGPPHRRKFTVMLKLGDSEFEAQGTSIKKAQHEAAAIALRSTKYKHPPPKLLPNTRVNTTPTVELNALAMKRGEPTVYTMLYQPVTPYFHQSAFPVNFFHGNVYQQTRSVYSDFRYNDYSVVNGYSYSGNQYNNMRYRGSAPYKISLKVGSREYIAEGSSAQMARHKAAKRALNDLRSLPEPDNGYTNNAEGTDRVNEDSKSPISAVHECAFRHSLQATFEVTDERGPPHMRTFVTECRVGDQFRTVGEGNGKKISKRRAAEKMLTLMKELPEWSKPPVDAEKKRSTGKMALNKKRNRVIKDQIKSTESGDGTKPTTEVNPTTRLMEYQKKRHAKEPVYILVEEKGWGRKKQFSIEVKIDNFSFVGVGTSKKDAKRQASEGMLKLLGLETSPASVKETTAKNDAANDVAEAESPSPVSGKQIAPGILLVPHASVTPPKSTIQRRTLPSNECSPLTNGTSHFIEAMSPPKYARERDQYKTNFIIQKSTAKDQLIRLVDSFGYEAKISNFPKGHHHQEFLSLVTLNTIPPQTYYGSGSSTENAQNEAAFNALSMISEMGIENLFAKKMSTYIPENELVS